MLACRRGRRTPVAEVRAPDGLALALKTIDTLFSELAAKVARQEQGSGTVKELAAGIDAIGKKLVEEAAEVWMAARYETQDALALELSQLLYHALVMAIAAGVSLQDICARL